MMGTTTSNSTDYSEQIITAWMAPQIVELGLFSVAGGEVEGAGTEFSAGNYARVPVEMIADPVNTDQSLNSGTAVAFGTPSVNWGDACEIRAFNSYGQCLYYYTLSPTVACDAGSPVSIPINMIVQRQE